MATLRKIKYTLVYNRQNKLNRYGEALIQIRAYQNGSPARYFSTGIYLEPKFWDEKNKCIRNTHPNEFIWNKQIRERIEAMKTYENQMINRFGCFSVNALDDYETAEPEPTTFTEFMRREIENRADIIESTKVSHRQTLNKLLDFRKIVHFHELNFQLINNFDRYLLKQGLDVNGVDKHHKNLTTYINLAIRSEYLPADRNPYIKFKRKTEEPDRTWLEEAELAKLEEMTFSGERDRLLQARNFFLLCCYTGLRFSDVSKLSKKHLEETPEGLQIRFTATKTKKTQVVPVWLLFKAPGEKESKPEALLRQLVRDHDHQFRNNPAFDAVPFFGYRESNSVNRPLKEIADLLGMKKRLTTHVGRRTFATLLAEKSVGVMHIKDLLNHATINMTLIYVRLSNAAIKKELAKVTW